MNKPDGLRRRARSKSRFDLTQLCNHRFWLKAQGRRHTVNGWVTFASNERLALEVYGDIKFKEGDEALCSISHQTCTAQFVVEIVSVLPTSLVVEPKGVMHVPDRGEDPRRKIHGEMNVSVGKTEIPARVLDVSVGGIGLAVEVELEKGTDIECEFAREDQATIFLAGRVAYCRQASNSSEYRLGVKLEHNNRLDHARWKNFVREGETLVVRRRTSA